MKTSMTPARCQMLARIARTPGQFELVPAGNAVAARAASAWWRTADGLVEAKFASRSGDGIGLTKAGVMKAATLVDGEELTKDMEGALKAVAEHGEGTGIRRRTAAALDRRNLATVTGDGVMSGALVTMRLSPKGLALAIELFRAEHADRVAHGDRSERIPRVLAKHGATV